MNTTSLHKASTTMRWVTRGIALLVTILFLFWYTIFGVGSIVVDLHGAITADIIPGVVFGILVLTGYILSWWRERIGGVLFILASVGVTVAGVVNLSQHLPAGWSMLQSIPILIRGWLRLGLPLLITGILFLIVSWLSRMERSRSRL
jgi:hypothetical protein